MMENQTPTDKDNQYHGKHIYYYPDGKIEKIANYHHGKLHGEFISYWWSGNIYQKTNYTMGKAHGLAIISDDYDTTFIVMVNMGEALFDNNTIEFII